MCGDRYGKLFRELNFTLFTGNGGFYHWMKLPGSLTASDFNKILFEHGAAILEGTDCDMRRLRENSPLKHFVRFSFGPLPPDSFEEDAALLRQVMQSCDADLQ